MPPTLLMHLKLLYSYMLVMDEVLGGWKGGMAISFGGDKERR